MVGQHGAANVPRKRVPPQLGGRVARDQLGLGETVGEPCNHHGAVHLQPAPAGRGQEHLAILGRGLAADEGRIRLPSHAAEPAGHRPRIVSVGRQGPGGRQVRSGLPQRAGHHVAIHRRTTEQHQGRRLGQTLIVGTPQILRGARRGTRTEEQQRHAQEEPSHRAPDGTRDPLPPPFSAPSPVGTLRCDSRR
jgi:hypothetical protein